MIEPDDFDQKVRKPAKKWLDENDFPLAGPVPKDQDNKPRELKPFWRDCLDDLYKAYDGICAYASMRIHRTTGARSTDHFIAKLSSIEHAYEWANYRLACQKMNSRKGTFDELLDPFEIKENTFELNLLDGRIDPNPSLTTPERERAQTTINRLGLNDEEDVLKDRLEYITNCLNRRIVPDYLREEAPFVWYEMRRQNALPSEPSASESA